MIGAGTFINPLIKIATTVAILAFVFIFIVKPVLETTENVSRDINHSINHGFNHGFNQANRQVQQSLDDLGKDQQTKVTKSIKGTTVKIPSSSIPNSAKAQMKIAECVQRAAPNTTKMQVCVGR